MTEQFKKALSELIQWCDEHKSPITGAIEINDQLVVFGNNVNATLKEHKHIKMLVETKGNLEAFAASLQKEYDLAPSLPKVLLPNSATKH